MKKFYAFAAAAVAALSMNAQIYVCGAGEGLGWAPENPMVVEAVDGSYTFEVKELTALKMSTAFGDWDTFNGGALYTNLTEEGVGEALALENNGEANILTPWEGDWKVVVSGDFTTATFTTTTPKPEGFTAVYIRGGMCGDGWPALEMWQFTTEDGITYKFEAKGETTIPAGIEFKIADAKWGQINYGADGVVTIGEELWWNYNALNATVAEDFEGTITAVMPDTPQGELQVFFAEGVFGGVEAIETTNGEAEYFNLQGVRVANPSNGLYIVRQGDKVSKQVIR